MLAAHRHHGHSHGFAARRYRDHPAKILGHRHAETDMLGLSAYKIWLDVAAREKFHPMINWVGMIERIRPIGVGLGAGGRI